MGGRNKGITGIYMGRGTVFRGKSVYCIATYISYVSYVPEFEPVIADIL